MNLPITAENVREWFPAPTTENPMAGEPWWQLQALGLFMAMQIMRLVPAGDYQQQTLIELRRAIDTGLLVVPTPSDEEITRRMARTLAPWCPSPFEIVEAMLDLADVKPDDRVLDLGCGDGRIVFAAAARGAWGTGLDIDARFVAECNERKSGFGFFTRKMAFYQADVNDIDLKRFEPTVVTCYLLSASMRALEQKFRALPSGTRIISHAFDIEGWTPTNTITVAGNPIYLWVV